MMSVIWIFLGGGLGSVFRYAISEFSRQNLNQRLLWGTLLANIISCIVLALLIVVMKNKADNQWLWQFIAIGFCGGFSTFSTFSYETFTLLNNQQYLAAILNVVLNVSICLIVFYTLWQMKREV